MNGQANSPKLGICFLGLEDKSIKWTSPDSLSKLGHYHLWGGRNKLTEVCTISLLQREVCLAEEKEDRGQLC